MLSANFIRKVSICGFVVAAAVEDVHEPLSYECKAMSLKYYVFYHFF